MHDNTHEYGWFVLNAILVVALIALGTLLQIRHEAGEGAPAATRAPSDAPPSVVMGRATSMTVEAAPAPQATQEAAPAPQRPPVRWSDDNDD